MGIFSNIFSRRETTADTEPQKRPEAEPRPSRLADIVGSIKTDDTSRVDVDGDKALSVTAYLRGLDIIASNVARVPFEYYRRSDGVLSPWETSPFHYLLTVQPQPGLSAYEWRYNIAWQVKHDGHAFVLPRYAADGALEALTLLSRHSVTYEPYTGTYNVTDFLNGIFGTYAEADIIHLRSNTHAGPNGSPLLSDAAKSLSVAATAANEMHKRVASGGNVKGIISSVPQQQGAAIGNYKTAQVQEVAENIDVRFRYGQNFVGIPGAMSLLQLSQSSADMQFMDAVRYYSVDEVARLLGIPGYFLNENTGSNYKSVDEAHNSLMQQTIDPLLCLIEGEFQRKLVPQSLCHKRQFRFDRDAFFTLDFNGKARYMQQTIAAGVFTINDWRRKLNQPAIDGGDTVFLTTNMAAINSDKLNGQTQPRQQDQTDATI